MENLPDLVPVCCADFPAANASCVHVEYAHTGRNHSEFSAVGLQNKVRINWCTVLCADFILACSGSDLCERTFTLKMATVTDILIPSLIYFFGVQEWCFS